MLPTGRREMSRLWVLSLILGLAYAQVHSNDSGLENNQLQATPRCVNYDSNIQTEYITGVFRFLQQALTPGSISIYITVLLLIALYQLSLPILWAGQIFLIESLISFVPDIKLRKDKKGTSIKTLLRLFLKDTTYFRHFPGIT